MSSREDLQLVCMGESGAGKSEFLSGFPKPMLVVHTDPTGKAMPYVKRGVPSDYTVGEYGQRVRQVMSRKQPDTVLIQLEFFHEAEPTQPSAFDMILGRWLSLRDEVEAGMWRTVVLETFTTTELYARYRREFSKMSDPEKSNIYATSDMEMLLSRLGGLHCNVCIACHIDSKPASMNPDRVVTDKKGNKFMAGGQLVATPQAPGRLQKGIPAMFASEMYRVFTGVAEDGSVGRFLQTENDGKFACATRIGAPNGCEPAYQNLWTNWSQEGGNS